MSMNSSEIEERPDETRGADNRYEYVIERALKFFIVSIKTDTYGSQCQQGYC